MNEETKRTTALMQFLQRSVQSVTGRWTAVSLFSGAGLSDMGYLLAGFEFVVQVELEPHRAAFGRDNFPSSNWLVGDVRKLHRGIVETYRRVTDRPLDLLVATPPCQGMSSSNPSRGRRKTPEAKLLEEKNRLLLELAPIARALKPRVIVAENVRQLLTLTIGDGEEESRAIDVLKRRLRGYTLFEGVVNVADYGIPQDRRRAVLVAVRKDQAWLKTIIKRKLAPWPKPTHAETPTAERLKWLTVREWFEAMSYDNLDARSKETACGSHPLHFVPFYDKERYRQVADIPPFSGRSAYQNDTCPNCGHKPVPEGLAACPFCHGAMFNRPIVIEDGVPRLIKGFDSSYRRMFPDRPASTVTTNSSHVGSDIKIHPWENRVLSIIECADLQTVPRFYNWSRAFAERRVYLVRNVIGEAFPSYFTYLHGQVLGALLDGRPFETLPLFSLGNTK